MMYTVGSTYTRNDIYSILSVPEDERGGDWNNGYHRHGPDYYVFCTVGVPGRTGHDHANRWVGEKLEWHGKSQSHFGQPTIQNLISGDYRVLVFHRNNDRGPFTFAGIGQPIAHPSIERPARIDWTFEADGRDQLPVITDVAVPSTETHEATYPAGLLKWAGHRDGGVRKPFRKDSGRPTGDRINTPLVERLKAWVSDVANNEPSTPRTLLLVGGPGNGKTDAVESCIEFLDRSIDAGGRLLNAFASQYDVPEEQLPPRKVVVDLQTLDVDLPSHLKEPISVVQDATDPSQGIRPEELLLDELGDRIDPERKGIYLCCVNRGILANAATVAHECPRNDDAASLLSAITAAATSGPKAPACWPLDGFKHVAVWPMDVESLVDTSILDFGRTVAHQIFEAAIDESRWVTPCKSSPRCPFCQNRKLLSKKGAVDSLVQLLRFYELASGKRWTFRDLFSLVPYLLVGDYSELEVKSKPVSPCEWSAFQLELRQSTRRPTPTEVYAPYLLASRLYYHRLFPRWPTLNKGDHRKSKSILDKDSFSPGIGAAHGFFRFLANYPRLVSESSNDTSERIRESLGEFLDPALATGGDELFSRGDVQHTVDDIEGLFSLGIREGLETVKGLLEPLERDVLQHLADADEALVEDNFPRTRAHNARLLQSSVRQYCARLVKRSIGTRRGVCRYRKYFEEYEKALTNTHSLLKVRKQLKDLLHDDRNRFRVSLVTTFGQPVAHRSREIALVTQRLVIKELPTSVSGRRPPDSMPYLLVDKHIVPLTFPLFKALREISEGLHDASLPTEIFALINGIRSLVAGHVVRDESTLEEEAWIELGTAGETVEIVNDGFEVMERESR
jgi:hypothetical protein